MTPTQERDHMEEHVFSTILYATDGSDHARRALAVARDIARRYDATVVVLTAYDPLPRDLGSPYVDHLMAKRLAAGEALVRQAAEALDERGVRHEETVLEGPAAAAILEAARTRGCDLIVLGSRGLGRVEAALLGSVSQQVVQQAPCPVLIVR
ncbi:MAG: universal stress protein [Armatimonadota bacterium]|nr:universal stress protein [Armatimonadota bacterium]MDR7519532.1 universal stress protein [Armatimonadota bacterium]MDR7548911.1 universal stress protein [Armatimonadota bacterium]